MKVITNISGTDCKQAHVLVMLAHNSFLILRTFTWLSFNFLLIKEHAG